MIRLQNLPQMVSFNFKSNNNQSRSVSTNNILERTPQFDTVNFTGKKPNFRPDDDIIKPEIYIEPDEDIIEPEIVDIDFADKEAERRRKQQEDDDIMLANEIAVYSILLDEMNNNYDTDNDYSSSDNGFDDFDF